MIEPGQPVSHPQFGNGTVVAPTGDMVVVEFASGFQRVRAADLRVRKSVEQAIRDKDFDHPLRTLTRLQAEAVTSVNSRWGVFSRSRIALLPHQLWVCRKALEKWPARLMIADDVGLGKTVEAGLILMALQARGLARRVLILCPASLAPQWQERLRKQFDLRFGVYVRESDTARSDYWNSNDRVIASFQTMRIQSEHQKRLMEAEPWDVVVVDEAHHLGADEERGPTLGYKLVDELNAANRLRSLLFFTGTPHRGKAFGFFSLMHLVAPDQFDARAEYIPQYERLSEHLIRNNKQNVTDLRGNRLFQAPCVTAETYSYSPPEAEFYKKLTNFIITGEAYAGELGERDARAVMLVLITMQKLASSSVAAVRRAIAARLEKLRDTKLAFAKAAKAEAEKAVAELEVQREAGDEDGVAAEEEALPEAAAWLKLMKDEEVRLAELLAAADTVGRETKIARLLALLGGDLRDRPILFFTEYKATQALLVSELIQQYGRDSVAFINGDDLLRDVRLPDGRQTNLRMTREDAAVRFNGGAVRFLVSTEAGGEGIDLQERCWTLIHVDLPWNPMRMHQRVGRLNRYGQSRQVEVVSLRNPDTVEDRIWSKLNEKILSIMHAFDAAMEDPEDLYQLVLGTTPRGLFEELQRSGRRVGKDTFDQWFSAATSGVGGLDSVELVKEMIGRADKFDFQATSAQLPQVDLPDLKPLFISALQLSGRRPKDQDDGLSFETPENWRNEIGIDREYSGLHFERERKGKAAEVRLIGVGHRLFDIALKEAMSFPECVTILRGWDEPTLVLRVREGLSMPGVPPTTTVVALAPASGSEGVRILRDWEFLRELNARMEREGRPDRIPDGEPTHLDVKSLTDSCLARVISVAAEGAKPFVHPQVEVLGALLPAST